MELPDMRFKYLKYLAFALGGLSTVIAAGALYLHATFDGLRLAAELTHFAKQRHQRTLRIEGPVELSMFPRLRLQLPAGTLSGRNSTSEFIGFEQASVSVRLLPLLTRRVVVERVEIDGLRMALLRDKAGKLNAADLLGTDDNAPRPPAMSPLTWTFAPW
jgi:AsmA protein